MILVVTAGGAQPNAGKLWDDCCVDLRVKDVDFDRHQIVVRQGKGQKDRVTMLPFRTTMI